MERRPDRPTRRALTLGLPWIPFLGAVVGSNAFAREPGAQAGSSAGSPAASPGAPTPKPSDQKPSEKTRLLATVILIRHAEKDASGDAINPGLSEAGKSRALTLARLLAHARVSHLFASKYKRARETLQPFSEASGLKVDTDAGALAVELGPRILDPPAGSVVVVAGHANTIPALASALGAELQNLETTPQGPMIAEKDFGRMFVVTPGSDPAGKNLVLELAYGE